MGTPLSVLRISEEKEKLFEETERQSENLNEVINQYEQKDLDCVRLHKLVDDLQRKLEEEKAAREQNFATADQFTSRLRQAENKISEFEYRLQKTMDELSYTKDAKDKYELELQDLKKKFDLLNFQNTTLNDEVKQHRKTIRSLQQELDVAAETSELVNRRHLDEIEQLKSLLRSRDEDVRNVRFELDEKKQKNLSLNHSYNEKSLQCERHQNQLVHQNTKVLEVETKLREYEVELVALSQQRDGAMENANNTAQDLAQYVGKLEERVNDAALIKADLEQQVENYRVKLAQTDQEFADVRRTFDEREAKLRKNLFNSECQLDSKTTELNSIESKLGTSVEEERNRAVELQIKLDCQALEVGKLTSYLEDQIYEINTHHRKERSLLEDQVKTMKELTCQLEKKKKENEAKLSASERQNFYLKSKVKKSEKWEFEYSEKNELCKSLQASCDLLNERLTMTAKTSREFEQQLMEATEKLAETRERLVERERVASKLADDLNDKNKTIRKLKDELVAESERQLNEVNSMVESRLSERDEQISATADRVNQLCEVINKKDLMVAKTKEELQAYKRSSEIAIKAKAKELEHYIAANSHLQDEYDSLKKELDTTANELKAQVHALTLEAEESQGGAKLLDEQLSQTIDELNTSRDNGEKRLQERATQFLAQKEKAKRIMKKLQLQTKSFNEEKEKLAEELKLAQSQMETKEQEGPSEVFVCMQRKVEESELLITSLRNQLSDLVISQHSSHDDVTQKQPQLNEESDVTKSRDELITASSDGASTTSDTYVIVASNDDVTTSTCDDGIVKPQQMQHDDDDDDDASLLEVAQLRHKCDVMLEEFESEKEVLLQVQRDLSNETEALEKKVEEKNKEIFEVQRKLKAALISRKSVINKLKESESKREEHDDITEASTALLHHQVADMEKKLKNSEDSVRRLKEELNENVKVLNEKVRERDQAIDTITKKKDDLLVSEEKLKQEKEELNDKIVEFERENANF